MPPEARPHLPILTSLRFFAAFYVFCFHVVAFRILTGYSFFYRAASIGYAGVSFFFVLSGFILVYTYDGRSVSAREFWRARFARVYPAYVFSLLAALPWFLYAATHKHWEFTFWPKAHLKFGMLLQVFLLQAWDPRLAIMWNPVSWSLSVEAFFYLLFPFLLKRFERLASARLIGLALFFWSVSLTVSIVYLLQAPDHLKDLNSDSFGFWLNAIKFNPLARLPEFLIGMLCGFYFLRIRRDHRIAYPLLGGALLALGLTIYFANQIPYPALHSGFLAPIFAAIIYALALQPRFLGILNSRPMVLLGEASYSFYLLHFLIIAACYFGLKIGSGRWGIPGVLLCFAGACGLSILVYLFVEVPARRKLRGEPRAIASVRASVVHPVDPALMQD
jgi:peptidoglycan/LPS O-acetylase OafA/YrhL